MLAESGRLDPSPSGPHPLPPEATWGFTQHAPFQGDYETDRRSVYLMVQRNRRHPFLGLFDGADPNVSVPERRTTTVPTQALFFMNDPFVHRQAEALADRVMRDTPDNRSRIQRATLLTLGRDATPAEMRRGLAYIAQFSADAATAGILAPERPRAAWSSFARILFGSNAFLYVE